MPPQITTNSAAWHLTSFVGDSGQEFTDQQWYDFCSARLNLMRPYLSEQTLPTLSKVECVRVESHKSELGSVQRAAWRMTPPDVFLEEATNAEQIQGIFGVGATKFWNDKQHPDGHTWIYGVERRSSTWVLAKVSFKGSDGWKGRGQQYPQHFELASVGISEMCETAGVHPQQVFEMLGIEVQRWYAAATKRYSEMTNLAHLVSAENLILKARMTETDEEGDEEEDSGDEAELDDPTRVE